MSNQISNAISFKREVSWGTAVTPDKSMPVNFTGGIQTSQDIQFVEGVKARLAKNHNQFVGNRTHEGDLEFALNPDYSGFFLVSALGDVTSALKGGETIVYEHDFAEVATKPSLTIEQAIGDNVRRYAGGICHTLNVSGSPGEVVNATASIMAKSSATATAITPVYTDTPEYNFLNAVIKIDGTPITEMQNFEFEYKNNLGFKYVLNSNDPQFTYLNGSEITGSFEMYLDSTTLAQMTKFLANTESALDLELTGNAIGVASNYQFNLTVPRVIYTTAETPLGNDYNLLTVEFEGLYDPVTSSLITGYMVNEVANYN
jgi:hypothetical protein